MGKSIKDFLTYLFNQGYNDFWLWQEPGNRWCFKANKPNCNAREATMKTRLGAIAKVVRDEKKDAREQKK